MPATDFKDYYKILGVSKSATPEEIKKAYRKLARKYHPDLNQGDRQAEQRFKEINEAQEVLCDPEKRSKYDQYGQYWQQAQAAGGTPSGAGMGADFSQYGGFDDFINELLGRFGGMPSGTRDRRTSYSYSTGSPSAFSGFESAFGGGYPNMPVADSEAAITLTLAEAYHGCIKHLRLNDETIKVRIPAGAKPGSRIRLKGKGQINPYNQQRGDLYLNISLQSHPVFKFKGDNIICEVPIAPEEAVLGAEIEVPTPDGNVAMKVPPGVNSGQSLRLKNKGWKTSQGKRSDQIVKLQIVTPKKLTKQEKEYYEKLRQASNFNPRHNWKNVRL